MVQAAEPDHLSVPQRPARQEEALLRQRRAGDQNHAEAE